jgi:hypothetical protein
MPAAHATRLKNLIQSARKTADQTKKSFIKAEDQLTALEDRDRRRSERDPLRRSS